MKNYIPTHDFAQSLGVKSTTVHRNLCIKGHYMGVVPVKLVNRRLLWPEDAVQRIIEGITK